MSGLDGCTLTESSYLHHETLTRLQELDIPSRRSSSVSSWPASPLSDETLPGDLPMLFPRPESGIPSKSSAQIPPTAKSLLIAAIQSRNLAQIQAELGNGTEIMAQGTDGWTALHHAAHCGSKRVLKIILESRQEKDVNATDSSLQTPLHIAAMGGRKEIGSLLLNYGADINAKNKCERTPLYVAVYENKEDFVEMLIKRGAFIDREGLPERVKERLREIENALKWREARASQLKHKEEMKTSKSRLRFPR